MAKYLVSAIAIFALMIAISPRFLGISSSSGDHLVNHSEQTDQNLSRIDRTDSINDQRTSTQQEKQELSESLRNSKELLLNSKRPSFRTQELIRAIMRCSQEEFDQYVYLEHSPKDSSLSLNQEASHITPSETEIGNFFTRLKNADISGYSMISEVIQNEREATIQIVFKFRDGHRQPTELRLIRDATPTDIAAWKVFMTSDVVDKMLGCSR